MSIALVPSPAFATAVQLLPQINHVAGDGAAAYAGDGVGANVAAINLPQGVAVDGGENIYIADTANNRVRRIDAITGLISTVAGSGLQGYTGDGALATNAELNLPEAVAVDSYGNLWIADTGNSAIRKVSVSTGYISTVAGNGTAGYAGDAGLATAARLNLPAAEVVDASGNLYIVDTANNRIRRVDHTTQIITTYAGNGSTIYNGDGIPATLASLSAPKGAILDAFGDLFVSDTGHNLVREIIGGNINIVAGVAGFSGYNGDGGSATTAWLNVPTGLAFDTSGNLYISDSTNARIREVVAGVISTLAGTGTAGFNNADGALASTAQINQPFGLAVDGYGQLYVADSVNNAVRVIADGRHFPSAALAPATPTPRYLYLKMVQALNLNSLSVSTGEAQKSEYSLTTIGSTPAFSIGGLTACTGSGTSYAINSVCVIPLAYAPVYPGLRMASLSIATSIGTFIDGLSGVGLGPQTVLTPGVISTILPLLASSTSQPTYEQLALDPQGDVFVADKTDGLVYVWCAGVNSAISCAGKGAHNIFVGPSGAVATATLNTPMAVALDAAGNLFITQNGANNVLRVDASTHVVTTVAGTGVAGFSGDNGLATNATLHNPTGIVATSDSTLYIADTGNNVIRRVDGITGVITTAVGVAGSGGGYGDGGLATQAYLNNPFGLALDDQLRLYIADTANSVIRRVDPVTGIIQTVAGINGSAGFTGDTYYATNAHLASPLGVAVDAAGDLYIADAGNARIRRVDTLSGFIETIAGSSSSGLSGDGGAATSAGMLAPTGVGVDSLGQVIVSDQTAGAVRSVTAPLPAPLVFQATTVGCGVSPLIAIELANIGNASLSLSTLSIPADFSLVNINSHTCVGNAQQFTGSVCDMNFVFTPTVAGNLSEAASVTDNTLNLPGTVQAISLSGIGQPLSVIPTTMTLTASPSSLAYGAPVLLTASVTSTQGPVTSGTVLFSVNGVELGSSSLNGQGVATLTIPAGPTGTNQMVLASHAQQCSYGPSAAQTSITVVPAATQVTLISSATQVAYGQPVTLEAIVTAVTSGVPTGFVNIMDGTSQIGQATLNSTGYATIVLNQNALPLGPNTFTADYLGDPNFLGSTSNAVVVNVYDAKLTMSINPGMVGLLPGASAQVKVILTPMNGFNSPVTLSCAGLSGGATCAFSPQTIAFTPQMGQQNITLTIQSNILATAGVSSIGRRYRLFGWLMVLLTTLTASLLYRVRKRAGFHRAVYSWVLMAILCAGSSASLGMLSGCSGGMPKPPVYASVTVQAFTPTQGILAQAPLQVDMGQ